jgi:hypothetical protein
VTNFRRFTFLTSALAAGMAVACTGTALAATNITVTVTGGGTFSAKASPATLKAGKAKFKCATATASLTINNQTGTMGPAPLKIGTAAKFAFQSCTGPFGPATLTVRSATYQVSANSTTDSAGQTDLILGTFDISFSSPGCAFTISGDAPGWYDNINHGLGMGPKPPVPPLQPVHLTVSAVSGCAGLVSNGQKAKFTASYTLTPATLDIESSSSSM